MSHPPFHIVGEARKSRWVITCDHAKNTVPQWINGGDLGLAPDDMNRHIAYDVGAAGVTEHLSHLMDAPAVMSNFSRLVIDPNRGEDDPTLLMKLYDGTIIPANRHADHAELDRRKEQLYRPYHNAVAQIADQQDDSVILSMHSFTRQLKGRAPRPWHIAVLYSHLDTRLAHALLGRLNAEPDLCVGDNQPYNGHLPGDAIDKHALQKGRPNILIELRNDLIETEAGQREWAERLAPICAEAMTLSGL